MMASGGTWRAGNVGVVEMYEESLVVLAKLLGVPLTDVLHVPSRVSSSGLKEHSSHNVFVPHPEVSSSRHHRSR